MNLDNKVLVDRTLLEDVLENLNFQDGGQISALMSALAQDLSSYALVPVEPTEAMIAASAGTLPEYKPDDPEWDELEYEIVRAERHQDAAVYRAMIAAAQQPTGKEQ